METTSFRPTDKVDEAARFGPPAAIYEIIFDEQAVGQARVWSSGGYVDTSGTPMSHVGLQVRNSGDQPLWFDGDSLQLTVYDAASNPLAPGRLTMISPFGPTQIAIAPSKTVSLGGYFSIPVRPRAVDHMQLHWAVYAGDLRSAQTTSFVRDDDAGVTEAAHPSDARPAGS